MKKNYLALVVGLFFFPTLLISQTVSISGQVTRHNGYPVPDIKINCDGNVTTDVDGNFEFTDVALNYSCDLTPSGVFDKFEEVTVLDAVLMSQHILQTNSITNMYQILACDANSTQSITSLDIFKVMQLALRIDNSTPENWLFIDADYDFSNPGFSNPGSITVNATDTITDVDFIAIKRGDPAISSDYMPAPLAAPSPVFTISNESFQVGEEVQFEVTVEDFADIVGIQQTFKWDPSVLEFQSADGTSANGININDAEAAQGLLPSLSTINALQILDGEVIITLNFKALVAIPNSTEVLFFSDEITARQVVWQNPVDNELFIVDGEYMNGEGTTGIVNAPKGLESFEIFPNPVEDNFHVKALLQNAEDYEISIVNVLGQQVYVEEFDQKELLLEVSFGGFPAGTYFLSLTTADRIQTESFVKK